MWEWLNIFRLKEGLADLADEEFDLVEAALERVADAPFEPEQVDVDRLEGWAGRPERWIAWLPAEVVMVYRPYLEGPFPYKGKHIVVLDCYRIDAAFPSPGDPT